MQKHLAIFRGEAGDLILNGRKTVDLRFSKLKNPPFGVVESGDLVYIKPSGKDIIGQFRVKKVIFLDGFDSDDLAELKERYGKDLAVDDGGYWDKIKGAKFATLIFIGESSRFITSPIRPARKDLRGWAVLNF